MMTDVDRSWPEHMDYALARWAEPNEAAAEQVASFAQRWGGLDLTACTRAWHDGEEDDKLFALLALSHLGAKPARVMVRKALNSEWPRERWVSAIGLGEAGDKRALSALCTMLTEFLPEQADEPPSERNNFYFVMRSHAPLIIGQLGEPLAVPALRNALQRLIQLLKQQTFQPIDAFPNANPFRRALEYHEDSILYALGQLGAFGALTGIIAPEPWLRLWMLHVVMGHLHGAYPWHDMMRWRYHPELEVDIRNLLMFRFGLTIDEQDEVLDHYERTKLRELDAIYELELAREQEDIKW